VSGARLRAALAGATFGLVTTLGMVGAALDAPVAQGQAGNRVGVVVDTGSGVLTRCVTFSESSISGIEALQRAGLSPVVRSFSGEGGAVCAINGQGCPADSSCLSCQAPNYWSYHRAEAGAGGFTYSQVGAGNTTVTDGDVEGWRWGTGSAPGFRSIDEVCPVAPPPTTGSPPTGSPPPPPSSGGGSGSGDGGRSGGGDTPPASTTPVGSTTIAPPTTTSGADEEASTSSSDATAETLDGEEAAARSDPDEDGGSFPWLGVAAVVAVLGVLGWRVRLARRP
jgi:hypothetical protein